MKMKKTNRFLSFTEKNSVYTFLPTGDIFTFLCDDFLINQFRGNAKDGSVNNIYLRIYENGTPTAYPLLGIQSKSKLSCDKKQLIYQGQIASISYTVTFRPINSMWFWDIALQGEADSIDFVYGQDLGIGEAGGVYTNELYMSQYLGHSVFSTENGYVVCSRQNMPAKNQFPYIQQGVIGARAEHFSTDGLQFFGLSCKETNLPEALSHDLEDRTLQYEFAYTALQTEKFALHGTKNLAFYGMFLPNHPNAVTKPEFQEEIEEKYAKLLVSPASSDIHEVESPKTHPSFGSPYASPSFTPEEIQNHFPNRKLEEVNGDTLYSFFTPEHAHVVTKEKELACQRPHGTIIITLPDTDTVNSSLIASTQYMYGVFNSHVTVGNTDMHKFISTPRGFLNLLKNSGQRLYVKINDTYRLLTLPGLFEMGMNYSKWYYKLENDVLIVTSYTACHTPDLILEVYSTQNISYDFIVTNQMTQGPNEHISDINYEEIPHGLRFSFHTDAYKEITYDMTMPGKTFSIGNDSLFYTDKTPMDETFLTLSLEKESQFSLVIQAGLDNLPSTPVPSYKFQEEKDKALEYYRTLTRHFYMETVSPNQKAEILNETVWWYAHNAMIHFSMPHGLEQPGGAAWGTRDICQGPVEFFLATQHYRLVRNILLNIFSHQNADTKEWPQWFMFDRYSMNPGECHGDVIFWPLKATADYINASGDTEILKEILPYDCRPDRKESLLEHIKYALSNIEETRFIGDTGLITYAGGDWDDTLQPANEELKQSLVSAWTEALAYQTFLSLGKAVEETDNILSKKLTNLASIVKNAFEHTLIKDGVIAGFLENSSPYHYLLHPSDTKTGIQYRLLPMTRSIIAELVDKKQAAYNVSLIKEHLKCPDGIRLMDKPAAYNGGISKLFKRAEQAANVGREISLQYTHAHIRYIEAMAKLGDAREAWDSLFVINPILIQKSVPNACLRQSNMYFSSSEGAYDNRYDYAENFHLLKTGEIPVKGGWRLYSSGPGIYTRQLISNVLGIRFCPEGLIVDPVLPEELSGMTFHYDCFQKPLALEYHFIQEGTSYVLDGHSQISSKELSNPYRSGGLLIPKNILENCSGRLKLYICKH